MEREKAHWDDVRFWVAKMSMTWSNFAGFEYSGLMKHVTDFSEYRSY